MRKRRIFAKFVVDARDDADVWSLSHEAFRLWWSSILWCRDKGNDGFVPETMLAGLAPIKNAAKAAAELARAKSDGSPGFWIAMPGGWQVKNYGQIQDTPEDIARRNAAARVANDARWGAPESART